MLPSRPTRLEGTVVTPDGIAAEHATSQRIVGEGRILEALAHGEILTGTLEQLGGELGLTTTDLRLCLRELVQAGWIAVQTQPFGRLTVRV